MVDKLKFLEFTATMEDVFDREDVVSVTNARDQFGDLLDKVHYSRERLLLTKHSKPFGGFVSNEDLLRLEIFDQLINSGMLAKHKEITDEGLDLKALEMEYIAEPKKVVGAG